MMLYGKRNQHKNENTRKCRNYIFISQKFQPAVTERKKLREVPSKRGRVPLFQYFHLQAFKSSIHWVADWAFVSKFWDFFCREKRSPFLWASDAYLYQALRDACDQFFSQEEGLGPFRCYFYDLVYYVLCLGKGFACFLHDFGNKVVFSSQLLSLVFVGLGKLHLGG